MNKSAIVVRCRYQTGDKVKKIKAWVHYTTNPLKADTISINNNDLADYLNYGQEDLLVNNTPCCLWNKDGDVPNKQLNYNLNEEKGTIWDMVISIENDFCLQHGLLTKNDFYNLSKKVIPKFLIDVGLDPSNCNWYAVLHRNTKTPHIHLCFYETKETHKDLKIPQTNIKKLKSSIGNYLINNEKFYKQKQELITSITGTLKTDTILTLKNNMLFNSKEEKILNQMLYDLYNKIPKEGKLQYNAEKMKPYKKELDNIIEYILKSDKYKYQYEKYYNILEEHQKQLNALYGVKSKGNVSRDYINDQIDRLYTKVGNTILRRFKDYYQTPMLNKELDYLKKYIFDLTLKSSNNCVTMSPTLKTGQGLYRLCVAMGFNEDKTLKVFNIWSNNSKLNIGGNELLKMSRNTEKFSLFDLYDTLKRLGYNKERYDKFKIKYFHRQLTKNQVLFNANRYLKYAIEKEEEQIEREIERDLNKY